MAGFAESLELATEVRVLCVKGAEKMGCRPAYRSSRSRGEEGGVDYYTASRLRCLPTNYLSTKIPNHTAQTSGAARDRETEIYGQTQWRPAD